MIYKKQIIHIMPSLPSLFLAGIVIGNSCNAINRSKSDDGEPPLIGSVERKGSGLTSTSNVDRDNKVALQDMPPSLEAILGPSLSYLKEAPLVLEEADFDNNDWKGSFKKMLKRFSNSEGYSVSMQDYFKHNLLALIRINENENYYIDGFQIQDHEFELLTRGLNSVLQYYHYLHKIGTKLWEAVVEPLEPEARVEKLEELNNEWHILSDKKITFLKDADGAYLFIKGQTGNKLDKEVVYNKMCGDTALLFAQLHDYKEKYRKDLKKGATSENT